MDHIFPRFVDWNFGSGKYPRFKWGPLTEEAKAAIQDTFDKLAAAGPQANVTPEFMLDLEQRLADDFGFQIDYDKIKRDREKQQRLMQQQMQAQTQAMQQQPPPGAGQQAGQGPPPAPPPFPPAGFAPPGSDGPPPAPPGGAGLGGGRGPGPPQLQGRGS